MRPCIYAVSMYTSSLLYTYIPTIASMPHEYVNTYINKRKNKGKLTCKWIGWVLVRVMPCAWIWAEFSFIYKVDNDTLIRAKIMCGCRVADAFAGLWLGVLLVCGYIDGLIYLHVLRLFMRLWMNMLVCMYICVYVYMYLCMNMLLSLLLYMCASIHSYMRPSRKLKLKIETIPKFKIQFPKLEIQNPISDLRLKLKLKFQNYFSKTYWQNSIYMV